jgi:hypothetical protein
VRKGVRVRCTEKGIIKATTVQLEKASNDGTRAKSKGRLTFDTTQLKDGMCWVCYEHFSTSPGRTSGAPRRQGGARSASQKPTSCIPS